MAHPSIEFSTRRLAYAARLKGIPFEAFSGWLSSAERAIAEECYKGSLYPSAEYYLKAYGVDYAA
ncbi:MAG TPA: hypothetical protein VIG24_08245 [Acidimicrobiia bacterium]